MAEIVPVAVGRAIPAQTARNQRPQEERARPELVQARQLLAKLGLRVAQVRRIACHG